VWALIEQQEGKLGDGSLELAGEAARLAPRLKATAVAVVPGAISADQATLLARQGTTRVVTLQLAADAGPETVASAIAGLARQYVPEVLLAVNSVNGADIAARIATVLNLGLLPACDRVDTDSTGRLTATRPIYAGKAAASCVTVTGKPQIATLNPDALELKAPNPKNTAEVITVTADTPLPPARVRKVGFVRSDPRTIPLTEAEIVVSAGMGIGSKGNLRLVEELASVIGGSVGATRRVVDEGWIGLPRQVGLTGKTVHPRLYVACGISGAIQHTMGMRDSRAIIAINIDRAAPIFKIADVAILGDVLKVLPVLTAHLKKTLAQISKPTVGDVLNAAASLKAK
jgi:electron transfer flavoprotein alpha subunit